MRHLKTLWQWLSAPMIADKDCTDCGGTGLQPGDMFNDGCRCLHRRETSDD